MNPKGYEQIVAQLQKARRNWGILHDHYVRFCARAMVMADVECPANGIIPKQVGDDIYVQYLDRRIRISYAFNRLSNRGILCVDDLFEVGLYEGREPVRIRTISFDDVGNSDVADSDGVSLNLTDAAQGLQLALGIIDLALDHHPWKVGA